LSTYRRIEDLPIRAFALLGICNTLPCCVLYLTFPLSSVFMYLVREDMVIPAGQVSLSSSQPVFCAFGFWSAVFSDVLTRH
jgi:hypothetical protein